MKTFTDSPARPLVASTPRRTPLFAGNKVRIAWDAEQEDDYNNQRISQYKRAIRIADGCEHVSSITNSFVRKSQGTNEVGKLIVDGMTIGGQIANGLGYDMTMANLLQLRQEIDNQSIIRGYHTPSELQQIAEIDKMINKCREKSNKNFLLGTIMAACLFGVSLYTLLKNSD
jgi:hypothetical protein